MKTTILKRLCLYIGLASLSASSSLYAQSLDFVRFQPENISRSDLDYINIDALLIDNGGSLRVGIINNTSPTGSASSTKPTVAGIYFDGSPLLSSTPTFKSGISSSGLDFVFNGNPDNLPGGDEIGFSADSNFTATPPPPKDGINPGEFAYFDFSGSDYDEVLAGVASGKVRFGVHVLQVGADGEDSVSLVTVPEPSASLLGLIGAASLLIRRNR